MLCIKYKRRYILEALFRKKLDSVHKSAKLIKYKRKLVVTPKSG